MTRITLLAGVSLLFIAVPANAAPAPPPSQAPQQAPTATAPGNAADSGPATIGTVRPMRFIGASASHLIGAAS